MGLPIVLQAQLDRWYPLDPIPIHLKLINDPHRFVVVVAGRRSGKTERAKRKVIKEAMNTPNGMFFIAAPTYTQVKKIYWEDVKQLALTNLCDRKPSESELIVYLDNGSQIHLISLDVPSRIEGIPWTGGVIDEFAYVKEDAWNISIAPALDTRDPRRPGHKAWCWLIGKPDGLNHFYNLYQYAKTSKDPEWSAYTWKSSEVLDDETIASAKKRMSPKQFRQEYEASFETVSGRIYEDYGQDNLIDDVIMPHEQICYFCDFNYTPMSHGLAVMRDHHTVIKTRKTIKAVYVLDDIVLDGAVGQHNALEFVERYKNHQNKSLRLYGDRSGKNGEKHALESEYITMERVFREHGWHVDRRVKNANPSIKDSQNAVRAKICNANGEVSLFVNPNMAKWMHAGLATVTVKEGSSFLEDDKNDKQHITTALRYMIDYEFTIEDNISSMDIVMWGDSPLFGEK
jgi:hypothetical protein